MIDGNSKALENHLAIIDADEKAWEAFESDIDNDELVDFAIERNSEWIIDCLIGRPDDDWHLEALSALAEYALYEGEARRRAYRDFFEIIQKCSFFERIMETEKNCMFNEWLKDDQ